MSALQVVGVLLVVQAVELVLIGALLWGTVEAYDAAELEQEREQTEGEPTEYEQHWRSRRVG